MFTIEHVWAGNISLTVDGTQRENISTRKRRPWTLRAAQSGGNALFWGAMVRSRMFCRLRTHVSRISITDRSGRAGSQLWNNSWFCRVTVTGVITSRLLLVKTRRTIFYSNDIFFTLQKRCHQKNCKTAMERAVQTGVQNSETLILLFLNILEISIYDKMRFHKEVLTCGCTLSKLEAVITVQLGITEW